MSGKANSNMCRTLVLIVLAIGAGVGAYYISTLAALWLAALALLVLLLLALWLSGLLCGGAAAVEPAQEEAAQATDAQADTPQEEAAPAPPAETGTETAPVIDPPRQTDESLKDLVASINADAAPEGETPPPATDESRPATLAAPRDGKADDLKKIKGVGMGIEKILNRMGFYHFDQIAAWSETEIAWVDANLEGFKGRVTRDKWVEQAKILAEGGETEFSAKVDKGGVY